MKCGLLGEKLGHSYSPAIHRQFGDYTYGLFEKAPDALTDFLQNSDFAGINVTIPYKKAVIPYCAELTPIAKVLGAVNTIIRRADGSLLGHNTDYFGFETLLQKSGLQVAGKKVLVLGSGGASNTAVAVLKAHGANVVVISRQGKDHYNNLHLHQDAAVIVNATPVGMYPATEQSPLTLEPFTQLEGVLDLIYNPARTPLLRDAKARGLVAMNGLWMLVAQAKEASELFTGSAIADGRMEDVYRQLLQQTENLILIGMPGSGKSTVGQFVAAELGREFQDSDALICQLAGKSIPQIFAEDGEDTFRNWETEALRILGKKSGLVIATGGGCVLRPENEELLRQNGRIFCLTRPLTDLATDGRPLSQGRDLAELYRIRQPKYQQFADYFVANDRTPELAAAEILLLWEVLE